jgi:hypothetical protein
MSRKPHVRQAAVSISFLQYTLGVTCIVLGIAGLILPILPGWPFIFYGLECVGLGFLIPVGVRTFARAAGKKAQFWRRRE